MATGTTAGFWDKEQLPAVLKHELLAQYLPRFAGKLGNTYGKVVLIDGYAGEGKYATGAPGSAVQMARVAAQLASRHGFSVEIYLIEKDKDSSERLRQAVTGFSKVKNLAMNVLEGDVTDLLEGVVTRAGKNPLFMFLDPCGLGLSFDSLSHVLSEVRTPNGVRSAPTEVLLNFSADAIRRIGGHVNSKTPNRKTLLRMDNTVGGEWWRDYYAKSNSKEEAEYGVVNGYLDRLAKRSSMGMYAIPVKRDPNHRPIYYLVFGTRNTRGVWHFADSVARSDVKWREMVEDRKPGGQLPFDGQGLTPEERLNSLEGQAVPKIAENIAELLTKEAKFKVGDYPEEIFGEYLGKVRETAVRKAIKLLSSQGRTTSTGQGKQIDQLEVTRPS